MIGSYSHVSNYIEKYFLRNNFMIQKASLASILLNLKYEQKKGNMFLVYFFQFFCLFSLSIHNELIIFKKILNNL